MKYKIVIDKQSRTNPSSEKKEYEIDIEELRTRRNVYDSIVITREEAYVLRKLKLSDLMVLSELEEPIKEPLQDIKIELFEGDNYIYLVDMVGNKFYAEYLIKNEFNELYVTLNQMNSAINQSAQQIELTVNQKLEGYSTTEEMNSAIQITAEGINSEVSKKVGNDEIISKINQSAEAVKILANKLGLTANDVIDLIAGNIINLTSKNIVIKSDNFNLDKNGNMECKSGKFTGGKVELTSDKGNSNFIIKSSDGSQVNIFGNGFSIEEKYFEGIPGQLIVEKDNNGIFKISLVSRNLEKVTDITAEGIVTPTLEQTSLATKKKNFEKLQDNALEILKRIDIYKYNLKNEKDTDKKHIGFIIGDKYNYSKEITSNENNGVDIYSFVSVCCKAIQELTARVEQLEKEVANAKN